MFERVFIENFLNGYSHEEKETIKKDLKIVEAITFDTAKPNGELEKPVYLATAGGPGASKTTTLEAFLKEHKLDSYVYADPDQVSLKNMNFTYRKSLTNFDFAVASSNYAALKHAYDKWRGASNYICHEVLQAAFGQRYSLAHGTTSTSPHILSLYQRIKALDYRIVLLLCYSQDETRKQAISRREREQAFVQADPNDVISKGKDFPKRFDIYFSFADEIYFYWNDELTHGKLPRPCAKFNNADQGVTVLNEADWISFCKQYIHDIQNNNIEICKKFEQIMPHSILSEEKTVPTPKLQVNSSNSIEVKDVAHASAIKKDVKKSNAPFRFLSKPNSNPDQSQTYCGFKEGFINGKRF